MADKIISVGGFESLGDFAVTGSLTVSGSSTSIIEVGGKQFQFKDGGSLDAIFSTNYNNLRIRGNNNAGLYINLAGHTSATSYFSVGNTYVNSAIPPARLIVRGVGTTDATKTFLVEDTSGVERFAIHDSGKISTLGFHSYPESSSIVIGSNTTSYLSNFRTVIYDSLGIVPLAGNNLNIGTTENTSSWVEGSAILLESRNMEIGSWDNSRFSTSIRFNHINNNPDLDTIEFTAGATSLLTDPVMVISGSGKVGIGTTSPTSLLHLESAEDAVIRLKSTDNKAFITLQDNDTTAYISAENSKLSLGANAGVNANNLNFDISNNNVGIGTSSPSEKLEVREGFILSSGSSTSHGFELARDGNDTYQIRHLDGGLTINNLTDSRKEMTFNGTGNVGIGTTSPSAKLQVKSSGTTSATTSLLVENSAGTEHLKITDDGVVNVRQNLIVNHATNASRTLRLSWGSIYATDTNNELTLGSVYTDPNATRIYISGKNSDNTPSDAISMQANNGLAIYSGSAGDHFDPQALLHVSGSGIITDNLDVSGNLHVIGDLTVGKISNQSKLVDVGGNFNFDTVAEPSTAERTNFSSSIISSAGNIDNGTHYYHVIYKTADGGETGAYGTPFLQAIITDNTTAGQVQLTGIPTSSDARVTARDIYRTEADGSQYYGKKLATISDNTTTTYTDNLADSSLDQDTMFYRKANTTAGLMYVGNSQFARATNGHYTSFGYGALNSVTIGQDNVAIGGFSLEATTTGRENTAVGYSAGVNNTTGYGNTYLGYVSGYFNETGQKNTAVGSFALRQATLSSTSYNTAVGNGALWKLTGSNNHNTAIGHAAGQGYQGAYNVHIGSYTGYKSTEGSGGYYNINIGYYTGNDTTGDNNILIGRQLEAPNSGSHNQLNIGNLIYATGLGLGDTLGTGNVGIGTTNPTLGRLHLKQDSDSVINGITIEETSGGNTMRLWMDGSTRKINAGGSTTMIAFDTTKLYFPTGNVGIGTTSPQQLLDITDTDAAPVLRLSRNENIGSTSWAGESLGDIEFYTNDPSNAAVYGKISVIGGPDSGTPNAGYPDGHMVFYTKGQQGGALSEKLRITDTGNVGIGTTSPAYPLEVAGNLGLEGDTIYMRTDIGGSHTLKIGAPTTAGSTSINRYLSISTSTSGVVLRANSNVTENLTLRGNNSVSLVTSAGYALYATSAGDVGIGTSSPSSKLHIKGSGTTSSTTALLVQNANASASLSVSDDNKVGIGTSSPYATLTVAGNITQTSNGYLISTRKLTARDANGLALYNDGGQGIDIKDDGSVHISEVLTLTPQDPLPTSPDTGSFAVSASVPPKPYFYDGTSWNALY